MEYFTETMAIELAIWFLAAMIAKKANSQTIYRACDFWLIFVLSKHSWRITVPLFILIFVMLRISNYIGQLIQYAVVPEVRHLIRDEIREHSK